MLLSISLSNLIFMICKNLNREYQNKKEEILQEFLPKKLKKIQQLLKVNLALLHQQNGNLITPSSVNTNKLVISK